jgi:phage terminase large subunit
MSNKLIADLFNLKPKALIIADSAEPKSIAEIGSYALNIIPANKGPGSVLQGIQYIQDQRISVSKRSINIIKEYRNYTWITDKDGRILNEPTEFNNHAMDALRYGLESLRPEDISPYHYMAKKEKVKNPAR